MTCEITWFIYKNDPRDKKKHVSAYLEKYIQKPGFPVGGGTNPIRRRQIRSATDTERNVTSMLKFQISMTA